MIHYLNSLDKTFVNTMKTFQNVFKVNEWIQLLHMLICILIFTGKINVCTILDAVAQLCTFQMQPQNSVNCKLFIKR